MSIKSGCSNKECKISSGICGRLTFGSGELDDYGYWEFPCAECARQWEQMWPEENEQCWPSEPEQLH